MTQMELWRTDKAMQEKPTVEQFKQAWNSIPGVCRVVKFSDGRKRALQSRLRDPDWMNSYEEALGAIAESEFCRGINHRGWVANIDWFLRPDTVWKLLEGFYQSKKQTAPTVEPWKAAYNRVKTAAQSASQYDSDAWVAAFNTLTERERHCVKLCRGFAGFREPKESLMWEFRDHWNGMGE